MSRVAVIGAGSWGTTLAHLLAGHGHAVRLWAYEPEVVEEINARRTNTLFLPGAALDPAIEAVGTIETAVREAAFVVVVTPSHVVRRVYRVLRAVVAREAVLVSASKGIETESLTLLSAAAAVELPGTRFVALSGPSFAQEVYEGQPTAVVAASADAEAALAVQQLLSARHFRVYTSRDVIGTELGGALKNVVAIAAGILDGMGMGHNPRAALITRGLAETIRLGSAMGAHPSTFAGLAGLGDLVLTACGGLSRNRALGVALAQGTSIEAYQVEHRTVAEGVNTARAAVRLGERHGVELPIAAEVNAVLFRGKGPAAAVRDLMARDLRPEWDR